jgi:hypothetical protein
VTEKKLRLGQGGTTPKIICSKSEKESLKTAWEIKIKK